MGYGTRALAEMTRWGNVARMPQGRDVSGGEALRAGFCSCRASSVAVYRQISDQILQAPIGARGVADKIRPGPFPRAEPHRSRGITRHRSARYVASHT